MYIELYWKKKYFSKNTFVFLEYFGFQTWVNLILVVQSTTSSQLLTQRMKHKWLWKSKARLYGLSYFLLYRYIYRYFHILVSTTLRVISAIGVLRLTWFYSIRLEYIKFNDPPSLHRCPELAPTKMLFQLFILFSQAPSYWVYVKHGIGNINPL